MVEWHHRLNGHEFEPTLGDNVSERSLTCCSPWDHEESNTTKQLNICRESGSCVIEIRVLATRVP